MNIQAQFSELIKTKPHYINDINWNYIKSIISDIKYLVKKEILNLNTIKAVAKNVDNSLNILADNNTPGDILVMHEYVYDLIDYYISYSCDKEMYEISQNLVNLRDFLVVKIKRYNNETD